MHIHCVPKVSKGAGDGLALDGMGIDKSKVKVQILADHIQHGNRIGILCSTTLQNDIILPAPTERFSHCTVRGWRFPYGSVSFERTRQGEIALEIAPIRDGRITVVVKEKRYTVELVAGKNRRMSLQADGL